MCSRIDARVGGRNSREVADASPYIEEDLRTKTSDEVAQDNRRGLFIDRHDAGLPKPDGTVRRNEELAPNRLDRKTNRRPRETVANFRAQVLRGKERRLARGTVDNGLTNGSFHRDGQSKNSDRPSWCANAAKKRRPLR